MDVTPGGAVHVPEFVYVTVTASASVMRKTKKVANVNRVRPSFGAIRENANTDFVRI
jgi:hypothetical protein